MQLPDTKDLTDERNSLNKISVQHELQRQSKKLFKNVYSPLNSRCFFKEKQEHRFIDLHVIVRYCSGPNQHSIHP